MQNFSINKNRLDTTYMRADNCGLTLATQVKTIIEFANSQKYSFHQLMPLSIHFLYCVWLSTLCFIIKAYYPTFESRAKRAVSCTNVLTRHFRPQLPLCSSENPAA